MDVKTFDPYNDKPSPILNDLIEEIGNNNLSFNSKSSTSLKPNLEQLEDTVINIRQGIDNCYQTTPKSDNDTFKDTNIEYKCHKCNYTCTRLNVIIAHYRQHYVKYGQNSETNEQNSENEQHIRKRVKSSLDRSSTSTNDEDVTLLKETEYSIQNKVDKSNIFQLNIKIPQRRVSVCNVIPFPNFNKCNPKEIELKREQWEISKPTTEVKINISNPKPISRRLRSKFYFEDNNKTVELKESERLVTKLEQKFPAYNDVHVQDKNSNLHPETRIIPSPFQENSKQQPADILKSKTNRRKMRSNSYFDENNQVVELKEAKIIEAKKQKLPAYIDVHAKSEHSNLYPKTRIISSQGNSKQKPADIVKSKPICRKLRSNSYFHENNQVVELKEAKIIEAKEQKLPAYIDVHAKSEHSNLYPKTRIISTSSQGNSKPKPADIVKSKPIRRKLRSNSYFDENNQVVELKKAKIIEAKEQKLPAYIDVHAKSEHSNLYPKTRIISSQGNSKQKPADIVKSKPIRRKLRSNSYFDENNQVVELKEAKIIEAKEQKLPAYIDVHAKSEHSNLYPKTRIISSQGNSKQKPADIVKSKPICRKLRSNSYFHENNQVVELKEAKIIEAKEQKLPAYIDVHAKSEHSNLYPKTRIISTSSQGNSKPKPADIVKSKPIRRKLRSNSYFDENNQVVELKKAKIIEAKEQKLPAYIDVHAKSEHSNLYPKTRIISTSSQGNSKPKPADIVKSKPIRRKLRSNSYFDENNQVVELKEAKIIEAKEQKLPAYIDVHAKSEHSNLYPKTRIISSQGNSKQKPADIVKSKPIRRKLRSNSYFDDTKQVVELKESDRNVNKIEPRCSLCKDKFRASTPKRQKRSEK
ncbi:uncharacterized protein LOC123296882 [Chrysoperla carnea]|uniref:uncharacterized protein LOC123296882 n=1 Tax=Chrysoperla carnea TaxID=189513 RepID=UPI001D089838|nr:uncharacterized protein LOC123296882 [Chrysoperla carnea]